MEMRLPEGTARIKFSPGICALWAFNLSSHRIFYCGLFASHHLSGSYYLTLHDCCKYWHYRKMPLHTLMYGKSRI